MQVKVMPLITPSDKDGFVQTLSFALRGGNATAQPLPLDPYTIHFEDPEYNRALATQAGLAQRMIKLVKQASPNEFGLATLALATDRRSYNSASPLALRYDWDDTELQNTNLRVTFTRLRANGSADELVHVEGGVPKDTLATPGFLVQLSLSDLRVKGKLGGSLALQPDDRLLIKLVLDTPGDWGHYVVPTPDALPMIVDIVAEPVIPAPEAAYALLRRQVLNGRNVVECARFAWGPDASRIELVSKDDLVGGVVRRRAVFQWRDVVRHGVLNGYAVQKIAQNGATHIPTVWVQP